MSPAEFKARTKAFAVAIIHMVDELPSSKSTDVLAKQLVRSGTSVGANYRAACRAKSRADFISKMGNVEEECDESIYWMELLVESGKAHQIPLVDLMREGNEILALVVASPKTARSREKTKICNPQSAI